MEILIFLLCLLLVWFLWPIVWRLAFWGSVLFAFLCFLILVNDWESRALGRALYAERGAAELVEPPTERERLVKKCEATDDFDEFLDCIEGEP